MENRKSLWADNISNMLRKTEVKLLKLQSPYGEDNRRYTPMTPQELNFKSPRTEEARRVSFVKEEIYSESREDIETIKNLELNIKEKLKHQQRDISEIHEKLENTENELSSLEKSKNSWEANLRNIEAKLKEDQVKFEGKLGQFVKIEELREIEEGFKLKINERSKALINELNRLKESNEDEKAEIFRNLEETIRESQKKMAVKSELNKIKEVVEEKNENFTKELKDSLEDKVLGLKKGYEKTIKNLDSKINENQSHAEGDLEDVHKRISELEESLSKHKEKETETNKNFRREIEKISWTGQIDDIIKRLKIAENNLKNVPKSLNLDLEDFVEKREIEIWQVKYEKLLKEKKSLEKRVFNIEQKLNYIEEKPVKKPRLTISKEYFQNEISVKAIKKKKPNLKVLNEIEIEVIGTRKLKPKLRTSKILDIFINAIKKKTKKKIEFCNEITVWAEPRQKPKLVVSKGKSSQMGVTGKVKPVLKVKKTENFGVFGKEKASLSVSSLGESLLIKSARKKKPDFEIDKLSSDILNSQTPKEEEYFSVKKQVQTSVFLNEDIIEINKINEPKTIENDLIFDIEQTSSKISNSYTNKEIENKIDNGRSINHADSASDNFYIHPVKPALIDFSLVSQASSVKQKKPDPIINSQINPVKPSLIEFDSIIINPQTANNQNTIAPVKPILIETNPIKPAIVEFNPDISNKPTVFDISFPDFSQKNYPGVNPSSTGLVQNPLVLDPPIIPQTQGAEPVITRPAPSSQIDLQPFLPRNADSFLPPSINSKNPALFEDPTKSKMMFQAKIPALEETHKNNEKSRSLSPSSESSESSAGFDSNDILSLLESEKSKVSLAKPKDQNLDLNEDFFIRFRDEEINYCCGIVDILQDLKLELLNPYSTLEKKVYLDENSESSDSENYSKSPDSEDSDEYLKDLKKSQQFKTSSNLNNEKNAFLEKNSSNSSDQSLEYPSEYMRAKEQQKNPILLKSEYQENNTDSGNSDFNDSDSVDVSYNSEESSVDQDLFR